MFQLTNKGFLAKEMNIELFDAIFKQYAKPLFYYAAKFVDDELARDVSEFIQ